MAGSLTRLPIVEQLSPLVTRILGCNPSPMTLQGTNTYLIGNGKSRILLDTGQPNIPEYIDHLKNVLSNTGVTLEAILITHWHPDHIGGIRDVLKAVNQANIPIYKRKLLEIPDSKILSTYGIENPDDYTQFTFIESNQVIETEGAHLKAVHTPGHSTDHLCYLLEEENALFSGDCILGEGTTVFEDLHDYMNSLSKILNLKPKLIYPGHGPIVPDPQTTIEHYISHRQQRNEQILAALKDKDALEPMEITKIVYTDIAEQLYSAACHNVENHLRMLEKQGQVATVRNKWVFVSNKPRTESKI